MAKLKEKSYRLTDDRSGESFMLKTGKKGNLTVFDPKFKRTDGGTGARRAIRHCPNQNSIFVDEQDKFARVDPIIFINGYLTVSADNPTTQKFLDMHPSNQANSENGGWFEEVDDEKVAKESIIDNELEMDIKYAVRAKAKEKDGIHALRAVVAVLSGSVESTYEKGIEELKGILYNEIENDPYYFTDEAGNVTIFEDDEMERKYLTLRAIREGILKKSANGKSMLWAKDSKMIATAPTSIDLIEYFADYLTTDDGILVAEEIVKRS